MEENKQKSWFGRNWGWVLGGGCSTLIIILVLGIGSIFYGVTKLMKNSAPYEYALQEVKQSDVVVSILGESIEVDGMVSGNISYNNNTGEADLQIPVKGLKGEGIIMVVANKYNDDWTYKTLYIIIKDTQEEINLLDKGLEGF